MLTERSSLFNGSKILVILMLVHDLLSDQEQQMLLNFAVKCNTIVR